MRIANILAGIAVLVWFGLFLAGRGLIERVAGQRVVGYPNAGQVETYLLWPAFVTMALLGTAWLCNGLRRWQLALALAACASLLGLVPFLLVYSGGV
jgi:hypothetical protein